MTSRNSRGSTRATGKRKAAKAENLPIVAWQRKYPYPLFERALRIQADRLGVGL